LNDRFERLSRECGEVEALDRVEENSIVVALWRNRSNRV
jgi:hypothetical protein